MPVHCMYSTLGLAPKKTAATRPAALLSVRLAVMR